MQEDVYCEKLNWFKEHEKPEVVLLIADNDVRIRMVVAWTNMETLKADEMTPLKGETENGIWKWLWENTNYSLDDLRVKSSVSSQEIEGRLRPLIANRIIYPDGTINSFVQRFLREKVLKLFEEKPRKAKGRNKSA